MKPKVRLNRRLSRPVIIIFVLFRLIKGVGVAHENFLRNSQAGQEYSLQGTVSRVIDGDTFTLQTAKKRHTIRVASIDAPETRGRDRPGQPYGQASKRRLQELIANRSLSLVCYEQDQYGRDVCDVPLPCNAHTQCEPTRDKERTTASRVLVKLGLAWANREKQGKFLRDKHLPALQTQAKQQRRGLWQDKDPIAPWVWRYQCWRQKQCD